MTKPFFLPNAYILKTNRKCFVKHHLYMQYLCMSDFKGVPQTVGGGAGTNVHCPSGFILSMMCGGGKNPDCKVSRSSYFTLMFCQSKCMTLLFTTLLDDIDYPHDFSIII